MVAKIMFTKESDEYGFLSNFYPCTIEYGEGRGIYKSSEHLYQSQKVSGVANRMKVITASTPAKAKQLANTLPRVPDWGQRKIRAMKRALWYKFKQPRLRKWLLATGDAELVEMVYWCDHFWGVCHCTHCHGKGENNLGKLLMKLRQKLRDEQ